MQVFLRRPLFAAMLCLQSLGFVANCSGHPAVGSETLPPTFSPMSSAEAEACLGIGARQLAVRKVDLLHLTHSDLVLTGDVLRLWFSCLKQAELAVTNPTAAAAAHTLSTTTIMTTMTRPAAAAAAAAAAPAPPHCHPHRHPHRHRHRHRRRRRRHHHHHHHHHSSSTAITMAPSSAVATGRMLAIACFGKHQVISHYQHHGSWISRSRHLGNPCADWPLNKCTFKRRTVDTILQ